MATIPPPRRFEHNAVERYVSGKFASMKATTNDNGTPHKLEVTAKAVTDRTSKVFIRAGVWGDEETVDASRLSGEGGRDVKFVPGRVAVNFESRRLGAQARKGQSVPLPSGVVASRGGPDADLLLRGLDHQCDRPRREGDERVRP